MALICRNSTDSLAQADNGADGFRVEVTDMPSTFIDTNGFSFLHSELADQSYCLTSTRTPVKVNKQNDAKKPRCPFAQTSWEHLLNEHATSLRFLSVAATPLGHDESKPLFLRLRKLLL